MRTDWVGYWYEIAKSRGQNDMMTFANVDLTHEKTEWIDVSHAKTDGFGAFTNILDSKNLSLNPSNKKSRVGRPSLGKALRSIFSGLNNMKSIPIDWIFFDQRASVNNNREINYINFDRDTTNKIEDFINGKNFSLNSLLLSCFKDVYVDHFASGNKKGKILIPVDMRSGLEDIYHQQNCSSGVYVELETVDDPYSLHQKIKSSLVQGAHWGNWWLANIGKIIGKKGAAYLSKKSSRNSYYLGTFSNLGEWQTDHLKSKNDNSNVWLIAAPGSKNYPLFLGAIKVNGELTLSVKVHPSVLAEPDVRGLLIEKLRDRIEKLL